MMSRVHTFPHPPSPTMTSFFIACGRGLSRRRCWRPSCRGRFRHEVTRHHPAPARGALSIRPFVDGCSFGRPYYWPLANWPGNALSQLARRRLL